MAVAAVATKRRIWTDQELEALPRDGRKFELLDGHLIMSPVHANHGMMCMRLGALLFNFVRRHKLGQVYDSSTGFRLSNKLVLSPDVSFVTQATLNRILVAADKFLHGAPDLVIEVLSPSDRMVQINRKMDHYFEHGTRLAWLVNWRKEHVHVYTEDTVEALTRPGDTLTGGDLLPGFRSRLGNIFQPHP